MFWRFIILTVVALKLGSIIVSADVTEACSAHAICEDCRNDSNCQWVWCINATSGSCTNNTEPIPPGCIAMSTCTGSTTTTTASPVTINNTTQSANVTVTSPAPSTPAKRESTFDSASFIGGIVLVIVLEILLFFLYKFFHFKDVNYGSL